MFFYCAILLGGYKQKVEQRRALPDLKGGSFCLWYTKYMNTKRNPNG